MRKLAQGYLENMREAFTYLSHDSGSSFFTPYSTIPLIILVFVTATASSILTCIIGAVFSMSTILLANRTSYRSKHKIDNRNLIAALKALITVLIMVSIVSAPAIIVYGIDSVYMFILRTLSSSMVFVLMLRVIGWWNMIRGLEIARVPKIIVEMVYQTIKFIPLFLSEALKLLTAREARILGRTSLRSIWGSLSGIVAELIIKAYYKSAMLNLALSARTLSYNNHSTRRATSLTVYDVGLIMVVAALLVYEVVYRVWSGLL